MTFGFGNVFDLNKGYVSGDEGYEEGYHDGYSVGYNDGYAVGSAQYIHTQAEASAKWVINHNMNKFPSVMVVDTANTVVMTGIDYKDEEGNVSKNTCIVYASAPFKGYAYLN